MRSLPALLVLLSAVLVAACGGAAPSGSPSRAPSVFPAETSPPPTASPEPQAVVSIETRGGECPSGSCNRLVNIEDDGRIHEVIPKDRVVGMVPKEVIEALQIELVQANYNLLQSKPFTGTCPTAVDGQETLYTFHVPTGDEQIASCKVAIDENHPLFRAVAAALAFETPSPSAP
jgi:hypothetical protein